MHTNDELAPLFAQVRHLEGRARYLTLHAKLRRLQRTTTNVATRLRVGELLRVWAGCSSENVIRGDHGHFAGCLGGGGSTPNPEFHQRDVLKIGGMKGEAALFHARQPESKFKSDEARQAKIDSSKAAATKGAAKLNANTQEARDQRAELVALRSRIVDRMATLDPKSAEYQIRHDEAIMLTKHIGRADAAPKSAPKEKAASTPRAPRPAQKKSALRPSFSVKSFDFELSAALNPRFYHMMYGDAHFKEAMSEQTLSALKEAARIWMEEHPHDGAPKSMTTKSDLVTYLVDRASKHDGPINSQADVNKAVAQEPLHNVTASQHDIKASQAEQDRPAKASKSSSSGKERPTQKKSTLRPVRAVPGYNFDLFAAYDPRFNHMMYGTSQFKAAMGEQTLAGLKEAATNWMQAHPESGKPTSMSSRKAVTDYLYNAMVQHDGKINSNADMMAALAKDPLKGDTGTLSQAARDFGQSEANRTISPDLTLHRLRRQLAAMKAH